MGEMRLKALEEEWTMRSPAGTPDLSWGEQGESLPWGEGDVTEGDMEMLEMPEPTEVQRMADQINRELHGSEVDDEDDEEDEKET